MTALASPNRTIDPKPWVLRYLWPVLAGMLILRVLTDMRFALVPDEAVYWSWSRHIALGYFDHPPIIAWINWIFSRQIGSTELGVRLPMTLLALGTIGVIVACARQIIKSTEAIKWVAIMWLVCPLLCGLATISTPDTPAIFFSTCALACAARIARRDDQIDVPATSAAPMWLLFGVFCGLALLSKYTTVLLPAAVVLSLLLSSTGRKHLRRPWIYLAALIALLIFAPDVWWNYRHQWASFLYQLHHGAGDDPGAPVSPAMRLLLPFKNTVAYLGGQALIWTPVLFVIGVMIMAQKARQLFGLNEVDRLLLLCAAVPLVLFGVMSVHKLGELNWPSFTYVPLSLLTGRWIAERNTAGRAHAVMEGCKLALIFTLFIHIPLLPGIPRLLTRMPLPHSARDLLSDDRQEFGRELEVAADGAPVVCNRHQDAALASFYMPGQPDVWCDGVGSRPTAYDYFDVKPDFSTINRVLFVGGHAALFVAKHHYSQSRTIIVGPGSRQPRTAVMASR